MTCTSRETGTHELLSQQQGAVLTLTMNRPEARNALTPAMVGALAEQLKLAENDPLVRCVVLIGAGSGFCAGGDAKAFARRPDVERASADEMVRLQRSLQHATVGRLHRMPKPTVAAVNGAAAGAGLAIALACDLRIMVEGAVLTTAFAQMGLPGDFGGAYFLTQLVGAGKARELYFTSCKVSAAEALSLGLANWVESDANFHGKVELVAADLAGGPSTALGYMKENLNRALFAPLEDCMDVEVSHHVRCLATSDHRTAAVAFVRGEKPRFHDG